MYDYFYGQQAELFSFYRVPKVLFTDEKFSNISSDAKLLYGIMLDRMNLSAKNGWVDELGRVYIIFTIEEVKGALGCAEKKAVKLLHELENRCGLIERKRIGLGKPNYIYVKNFVDNSVERQFLNCQKDNSGTVNKTLQELSKAQGNNTDIKDTDYNINYSEDDNPVALKADFILSLCELIVGSKDGLQPVEKTVIDRCVHQIYQRYFDDPKPENMPILEDLYNALLKQEEKEAHHVATALEIYVKGSLKVFNHRTNVDIQNRLVCYDIKELGNQLKKIGMLVVQDQVWGRVTQNRNAGKSTRYYIDEFHLLLKEEQTATYSIEIWKRFRKWGGIPTGITQNVKDLLRSPEIANILENSDFIYMLNQASEDRTILAQRLNISPHQLSYVTNSGEGEGLLFYGNVILPFVDRFPKDIELYRIMTTKLSEVSKEKEG